VENRGWRPYIFIKSRRHIFNMVKEKANKIGVGLLYLRGERAIKHNKKDDKRMVSIEKLLGLSKEEDE